MAKATAPADEGFLARMMRPTTASASKTHEKAATPPKVSRPVTRNAHVRKGESHGSPAAQKLKLVAAKKEKDKKEVEEEEEAKANAGLIEQPEPAGPAEPAEPEIVVPKSEPVEASKEESAAAEQEMPESMLVEVIEQPSTEEAAAPAADVAALSPAILETEKEGLLGEPAALPQSEPVLSDRIDVAAIMEEDERNEEEAERIDQEAERVDEEAARIDEETARIDEETARIDEEAEAAERGEGEGAEAEAGAETTASAKISEKEEEGQEQEEEEHLEAADQEFMAHEPLAAVAFDAAAAGFEVPVEEGISEACLAEVGRSDKPRDVQIEDRIADVEVTALAS